MVSISEVPSARLSAIDAFYREAGYGSGLTPTDRLFAADQDGRLVGVVRLCIEEGVLVLRGMRVAPSFQRKGIGRRLLSGIAPAIGSRECFLLGYSNLEGFYGFEGFVKIAPLELPPHLQERLRSYLAERPDVIAMRRVASASPAT